MGIEELFRQNFWVVKTVGVALASALAGSALVTTLATRAILDVEPVAPSASPAASAPAGDLVGRARDVADASRRARAEQAAADILGYNPFCPTCEPERGELAHPPAAIAVADAGAPLRLQLVATMESADPSGLLATVYDRDRGTTGLYGIGELVAEHSRIEGIGNGAVSVRTPTGVTTLRVGERPTAGKQTTRAGSSTRKSSRPTKVARAPASSASSAAAQAISCSGANTCVVDRAYVNSVMANPAALASQAAVRPTADGFKLTRVRAGSFPALLGLRRGDVLTEVNGQSLDSVDKVLTMATKLRRARTLEVTLLRSGKTVRKEIQIS